MPQLIVQINHFCWLACWSISWKPVSLQSCVVPESYFWFTMLLKNGISPPNWSVQWSVVPCKLWNPILAITLKLKFCYLLTLSVVKKMAVDQLAVTFLFPFVFVASLLHSLWTGVSFCFNLWNSAMSAWWLRYMAVIICRVCDLWTLSVLSLNLSSNLYDCFIIFHTHFLYIFSRTI